MAELDKSVGARNTPRAHARYTCTTFLFIDDHQYLSVCCTE